MSRITIFEGILKIHVKLGGPVEANTTRSWYTKKLQSVIGSSRIFIRE